MWIAFEPNGWMAHVNLAFSKVNEAIEDGRVRAYLAEQRLDPRRVLTEESEGHEFEVWQFGECYLGMHLQRLESLRWQGVLSDMLVQESKEFAIATQGHDPEAVQEAAWAVAASLLANKAAVTDPDDPGKVHFDPTFVRDEIERLVAARNTS